MCSKHKKKPEDTNPPKTHHLSKLATCLLPTSSFKFAKLQKLLVQ